MPYYIFKIFPDRRLEKVAEVAASKQASAQAKALRKAVSPEADHVVKVIYAETEDNARFLLSQVPARESLADDDW